MTLVGRTYVTYVKQFGFLAVTLLLLLAASKADKTTPMTGEETVLIFLCKTQTTAHNFCILVILLKTTTAGIGSLHLRADVPLLDTDDTRRHCGAFAFWHLSLKKRMGSQKKSDQSWAQSCQQIIGVGLHLHNAVNEEILLAVRIHATIFNQ